jgi:integrase
MRIYRVSYTDKAGESHEVKNYYVELRDHIGAVRRFPGYLDKGQTAALGAQIKGLIDCRASGDSIGPALSRWLERIPGKLRTRFAAIGLLDPERAGGGKPLAEHLNDFQAALAARGNTKDHVALVVSRAKRIIEGCKLVVWSDISASKVQKFLADLRIDTEDKRGISNQTFNFYLQAIKEFCNWAVQDRRASESPLRHLKGLNVRTDRRHDRRALSADEVRRLLEATTAQPGRYGMSGAARAILYKLAVETGLRANELRTLKVSSFDFDNNAVVVEAAYSKHRRRDVLQLRPDTVRELRVFVSGKLPGALVFDMPALNHLADMFKADLQAAGIDYQDAAGRFADFHSLRHTCGTLLAAAGVHPKTAQSIMRHSTIELTMSKYTHTLAGQESDAVAMLPDFRQKQQAIATGTDGKTADKNLARFLPKMGAEVYDSVRDSTESNCIIEGKTPKLEAAVGFEPTNNGFANRPLRPLGYAAKAINNIRQFIGK